MLNETTGRRTNVHDSAVKRLVDGGHWVAAEDEAPIDVKAEADAKIETSDNSTGDSDALPEGLNIPATIDWVGKSQARVLLALEAEVEAPKPRASLINQLEALTNTATESQEI